MFVGHIIDTNSLETALRTSKGISDSTTELSFRTSAAETLKVTVSVQSVSSKRITMMMTIPRVKTTVAKVKLKRKQKENACS